MIDPRSDAVLLEVTIDDRRRTVFVELGAPTVEPSGLAIADGDVWIPILSCRDWFGDERRDDLTAQSLVEIAAQLRGGR